MNLTIQAPPSSTRAWRTLLRGGLSLAGLCSLSACVVAPVPHREAVWREPVRASAPPPQLTRIEPDRLIFYPARGQSAQQQDRDRYTCYRWAVRETGTDPGMTPVTVVATPEVSAPQRDGREVAAGAVTGAAAGSILSSPRHTGQGMVLGALLGAVVGAAAQEQRVQQQAAAADAAEARRAEIEARARAPHEAFGRAMSACMEGRGYRVAR